MKALDRIRKKIPKASNPIRIPAVENDLINCGIDMVSEARDTKDRGNITRNQRDSFVWALYFNGELIDHGFPGPQEAKVPANGSDGQIWGRKEAERLIDSDRFKNTKGYVLMVASAVWYSVEQEFFKDEHVLYQEMFRMESLEEKYNGRIEFTAIEV